MIAITLGAGRRNARGKRLSLSAPGPAALAAALAAAPAQVEGWFSPHVWAGDHRKAEQWESSSGVGVDVDWHSPAGEHAAAPPEAAEALALAATRGDLPGSLFHLTPRGARVLFVFQSQLADRERFTAAARGAGAQVAAALAALALPGYAVDPAPLLDLARLLYRPNAIVERHRRDATLQVLRAEAYDPDDLAIPAAAPALVPTAPPAPRPEAPAASFADAARRWNQDHPGDWPRSDGACPACGHRGCFGRFPGDEARWACFSANHESPGLRSSEGKCHHGDALDLEAHAVGVSRASILKRDGYLSQPSGPRPGPHPAAPRQLSAAPELDPEPALEPPTPIRPRKLTKTYANLLDILRNNKTVVPEPIEFDVMQGTPTLGGRPVRDSTFDVLREQLELLVHDSKGRGLTFSRTDIQNAVSQLADERPFHPVAEYLKALEWDQVPRIDAVAEEILGADPETSAHAVPMIRRWFLSAVARPLNPGCKVDTVLILAGETALLKSSFFRVLAGDAWFNDSALDMHSKDGMSGLRASWIHEMAELESMQRARDANTVKAFLSSSTDRYRPPYGKAEIQCPRHSVIVGTTNEATFLTDTTGNRRYWIVRVLGVEPEGGGAPHVDLAKLSAWRDQLWAEAVELYRKGELWYFDRTEEQALEAERARYRLRDPWEGPILEWLDHPVRWSGQQAAAVPVTTAAVLELALVRPVGQWSAIDARRVATILRGAGYEQTRRRGEVSASRPKVWEKVRE